jgi:hypothetical protein
MKRTVWALNLLIFAPDTGDKITTSETNLESKMPTLSAASRKIIECCLRLSGDLAYLPRIVGPTL